MATDDLSEVRMRADIKTSKSNYIRLVNVNDTNSPELTSYEDDLLQKLKKLSQHHELKVGQLVRWKDGLKNRGFLAYDKPVIITRILHKPIFDPSEDDSCSPFFREPLNIVIGAIIDGTLFEFHADSRRFEPVKC